MLRLGKILLLMGLSLAFFATPSLAANFYVATSGSDGNSCQSASSPCLTIQEAIGRSSDGDAIYIAPGTYIEDLLLDKDILLRGPNASVPLGVDPGTRSAEAYIRGQGIVASPGVVFDGLVFLRPDLEQNSNAELLRATTTGTVLVANSLFDLALFPSYVPAACGSALSGTADWVVESSSFEDQLHNKDGACPGERSASQTVYLDGAGSLEMRDSLLQNTERGIYLANAGPSTIEGNQFLGAATGGIYLASDNTLVRGNTFSGIRGIWLEGGSGSEISNNLFSEENGVAIQASGTFAARIRGNAFLGGLDSADPVLGVTVISNSSGSRLDVDGNFWNSNTYPNISAKTYAAGTETISHDLWIDSYSDSTTLAGFFPSVESFAWEVDPGRGLSKDSFGSFIGGSDLALSFPSATAGKIIIRAYEGNYPAPFSDFYLGSPSSYLRIEAASGSSFAASTSNICLKPQEGSFPAFLTPKLYSFTSAWNDVNAPYLDQKLCAELPFPATFLAAHPGVAPLNVAPPNILGAVRIGRTVTADPGSWQMFPQQASYRYQWQRATSTFGPWENIAGEIEDNYALGHRDVSRYIRLRLRAENSEGQGQAFSEPSLVKKSGRFALRLNLVRRVTYVPATRRVLFARLSCLEGYCRINSRRAEVYIKGKKYRLTVSSREGKLIPGERRNLYLQFNNNLYRLLSKNKAVLRLRASSTNGDRLSDKVSGFVRK